MTVNGIPIGQAFTPEQKSRLLDLVSDPALLQELAIIALWRHGKSAPSRFRSAALVSQDLEKLHAAVARLLGYLRIARLPSALMLGGGLAAKIESKLERISRCSARERVRLSDLEKQLEDLLEALRATSDEIGGGKGRRRAYWDNLYWWVLNEVREHTGGGRDAALPVVKICLEAAGAPNGEYSRLVARTAKQSQRTGRTKSS